MNRYRCPLASRNKAAHDTFRNAVQAFSDRLDREGPSPEFVDELAATVNAWLVEHICKTDVALKPCIRRDGPCIPAAS